MGYRKGVSMPFPFFGGNTNPDECETQSRSGNIARRRDQEGSGSELRRACLIHMLAKHATPINASNTVLGRVPAMLRTFVMRMRSIAVLLRAAAIVNPPINSMIVGENMTEKIYLVAMRMTGPMWKPGHLLGGLRRWQTSHNAVLIRIPYYTQTDQKWWYEY